MEVERENLEGKVCIKKVEAKLRQRNGDDRRFRDKAKEEEEEGGN